MGVTVLGIQHRVGEYQGVHYDNYNLHCTEEVSGDTWQRGSNFYPRSPCGERRGGL